MISCKPSQILLAVLAHPDDETFGTGGTLALYAHCGAQVHLICATRGEVGEMDPKYMAGFSSIAERREAELHCAAEKLGLTAVHFLDYRDSGMPSSPDNQHPQALAAQPVEKVTAEVVAAIRKLKPQVVLTFDPIGGYMHPDHIAIHHATKAAFYAAGDPAAFPEAGDPFQPQKLYYQTISRSLLRVSVALMRLLGKDPSKFGKNGDIDLAAIAAVNFPVNARINYLPVRHLRDEAMLCHASQGGAQMRKGFLGFWQRLFPPSEQFMRAYPPPNAHLETDLFEGIE